MRSAAGQATRVVTVLVAVVWAAALLNACGDSGSVEPPPGTTPLTITSSAGERRTLFVEIAVTPEQRSTGLSRRTELPRDQGMLFIIPIKGAGFWMRDTWIPLSVAFIGRCGDIVHIADMEPRTETIHDTDRPYAFGLEVNQGWFEDHGVGIGSKVEIPAAYRYADCG